MGKDYEQEEGGGSITKEGWRNLRPKNRKSLKIENGVSESRFKIEISGS